MPGEELPNTEPTVEQLHEKLEAAHAELASVYESIFEAAAKWAGSAVADSEAVTALTERHPALEDSRQAVSARARAVAEEKAAQGFAALLPPSFFEAEVPDSPEDAVE